MGETTNLSVAKLSWLLTEAYDTSFWKPLGQILADYQLSGELEVHRGTTGDGVVVVPYKTENAGVALIGDLRFADDGYVYDGKQKLEQTIPPEAAQFLIASAFGVRELKSPFSGHNASLFEAGKSVFDCQSQRDWLSECGNLAHSKIAPLRRDDYNRKATEAVDIAKKMLAIAREEDDFPGGWDPDDFSDIVARYSALLGAYPSDTLEGAQRRLQTAEEMVFESAKTYSGALACVQLGLCSLQKGGCGWEKTGSITYYRYEGKLYLFAPPDDGYVREEIHCSSRKKTDSHGNIQ